MEHGNKFDLVVIGGGPGGYTGAIRAAQLGMKVALVEKSELGGTCLNRGCVPTKALLHSAQLYHEAKHNFDAMGIHAEGLSFDAEVMHARKDEVVFALRSGVERLLKDNGVTLLRGKGQVTASGQVSVQLNSEDAPSGGKEAITLSAERILLAVGSYPVRLPIKGAELPGVLTSDDVLRDAAVYPRIAIVGAGVMGVEFASFYTALGSEVALFEMEPRALPSMSREVGQSAAMMMKKRGAVLHTSTAIECIKKVDGGLAVHFTAKGEAQCTEVDAVLLAAGRRCALDGLFAEGMSPKTEKGFVVVDEKFATSVPGVYAIGDILPTLQLAHLAAAEAVAAVEGMAGHSPLCRLDIVPACVYTEPEIAAVGLSEDDAAQQGMAVVAQKFLMGGNARTLIEKTDRSYIKLIAEASTGRLVGAELICPRASDIVGALTLAIADGKRASELDNVIWGHPTFGEAVGEAGAIFAGGAIHGAPKLRR